MTTPVPQAPFLLPHPQPPYATQSLGVGVEPQLKRDAASVWRRALSSYPEQIYRQILTHERRPHPDPEPGAGKPSLEERGG